MVMYNNDDDGDEDARDDWWWWLPRWVGARDGKQN